MQFAEKFTIPLDGELSPSMRKFNVFREHFFIRTCSIRFQVWADIFSNVKVIVKVYRNDGVCEHFIVDTDFYDVQQFGHKRVTRDFYIHSFPANLGQISCVKFSYIVHLGEQSISSRYDYIFMERHNFDNRQAQCREITDLWATPNAYRTMEVEPEILQRDVDHYNHHFEALNIIPKFTRGLCHHPYHPKRFIHDQINRLILEKHQRPERERTIKVCVDCIDDTDFTNHLIFAYQNGVKVQCFVEVAPDMHNKFIIFGNEECILGSFNIAFDIWGANWESGATLRSAGICRLLDNVFQSIRGGVIQQYGIAPLSHFNLLYTFGRHKMMNGNNFRPHQAIISKIHSARRSIKACLFLLGELQGDHGDSVVDALIHAKNRGVELFFVFNGHMARTGDAGEVCPMSEELKKPLLPAIARLKQAGVPIALVYGIADHAIPYSPLHSKYCIIDDHIVLDGSFNWYNTSVFSHDHLIVLANRQIARIYTHEFHEILQTMRVFWG